MATTGKVTFGNNAATAYSVNNTTFGKVSGDNVGGSYSPYSQLGATTGNVSGYAVGQPVQGGVYQQGSLSQTYGNTFTSSPVTPVTTSFENKNLTFGQPQTTKINFGGKQFSNNYTPATRYETSNYVAPTAQYQTYQNYQSYQKPVEIQPVAQIQSVPIKEQVHVEQRFEKAAKVEAPPLVKGSKVETTPLLKESKVKKDKKGGCPSWLWPILGIIALLGLILGLLFGLGVFGRIASGNNANANLKTNTDTVEPASASTSTPKTPTIARTTTTPTTTPASSTEVPASTTDSITAVTVVPASTAPSTADSNQQPQGGFTVIENTSVTKKNQGNQTPGQTEGVTSPSIDTTPSTTVIPVDVTTIAAPTTTTTDFGIDPSGFVPAPVAATSNLDVATSPVTTQPSSSPAYTTSPYDTYPATSPQGYASNPSIDFVQPTSAQ